MSNIATEQAGARDRISRWLQVAAVGFIALMFMAAATDRRNTMIDRSASEHTRIAGQAPAPSTDELVREMLNHD